MELGNQTLYLDVAGTAESVVVRLAAPHTSQLATRNFAVLTDALDAPDEENRLIQDTRNLNLSL